MLQCALLPLASAAPGVSDDLQRVESLSRQTRATEARILDEIMGRMGRIESTTADIRALIEAMPAAGALPPGHPSVATPAPAAGGTRPAQSAVCPKPPPQAVITPDEDEDATQLPMPLVAGGSAALALLLGLLIGRRRPGTTQPLPAESQTSAIVANAATESVHSNIPLWQPKDKPSAPQPVPQRKQSSATPALSAAAQTTHAAHAALATDRQTGKPDATPDAVTVLPTDVDSAGGKEVFDPTLELAEIMMSMGLASGAAQALEEHIRENPREALVHWLKLLDVYRKDGHRSDFEKAARELRQNFNINASDWLDVGGKAATLEDFERVVQQVVSLWPQPGPCITYLRQLLEDNRDGMRNGFPQPVAEEIILLVAILRTIHPELAEAPPAEVPAVTETAAPSELA